MSTIAKENELLTGTPETASRPAARTEEPSARPQPVALEVPVTVNGARAVEGSDKREPFSESTKTVLIFGNGAVIRLSSAVAPGQLLFLTNEKTRKEVVCQVVKSKNYRNVSGYVELEFTEPVVGFWGMRFPTDRISSPAPAASGVPAASALHPAPPVKQVASVIPVAPKPEVVIAASVPRILEAKPAVVKPAEVKPAHVKPVSAIPPAPPVVSAPETPVGFVELVPPAPIAPPANVIPADIMASILAPATPAKVSALVEFKAPTAPPAEDSSEALRQQTARLQEQLSSLLFADSAAPSNAPSSAPIPPVDAEAFTESTAKIFEFANPASAKPEITIALPASEPAKKSAEPEIDDQPVAIEFSQPAAPAPTPHVSSLLDVDEDVKIPAWLEPLARNATAPISTQELIEREKAKHIAALSEKPQIEELAADPLPAPVQEGPLDLQVPTFGSDLAIDQPQFSSEVSSKGSKLPKTLGLIAATLFLAAGGAWYFKQQSNPGQPAHAAFAPTAASAGSNKLTSQPQVQPAAKAPALSASSTVASNPASNGMPAPVQRNQSAQPSTAASTPASLMNANAKVDVVRSAEPAQPEPQPKKPSLGEVKLAAPTVTRRGNAQNASDPEPAIEESNENSSKADPGAGIFSGNPKQPAAPVAPLPVGGDVKTAKLISSVPPVYSTLAKAQHISGDVKVDALIDATGHVTTMKVVSGPTLLHQSAMEALRQWKYQPATLDGKAVPMHLTVTIQFRMQ
jgi:protein TonB